jgi:hypothetical protein
MGEVIQINEANDSPKRQKKKNLTKETNGKFNNVG